jgi:mannose-1-phosphate guanylyltransferase/mannose-6-phosphate isomerase
VSDKIQRVIPVILCGGAGSRLWPMSRDDRPKQFHALFGGDSLLRNTLARMPAGERDGVDFGTPCVIGNAALAPLLKADLAGGGEVRIVLEPAIRDTAAAIAAVTALYEVEAGDALLLVVPSDARIEDHATFRTAVARAARTAAATDAIMLIGIEPTRPETQYGYIEAGEALAEGLAVRRFREKPDAETARDYLARGGFLWNAGMFLFRPGRMADAFRTLQPQIWDRASLAVRTARVDGGTVWLDGPSFCAADKLSVDYAIMEKADNVGVVPAGFDWDDLGSWAQLYQHARKDGQRNALDGDVIAVETTGSQVRARDAIVAVAGVDDLVVVAEDGKVLVTRRDRTHLVKQVTTVFKEQFAGSVVHNRSRTAIRRWLFEDCLPLWAGPAIDTVHGGVHEVLGLDGAPGAYAFKRLRVLPRQIYSFAQAGALGWAGMPDGLLKTLFETLVATGWDEEDGGWVHRFNPDGTVQDGRRDTYDQAFVLLALAWLHKAGGFADARPWADRTLDFMDTRLADRRHGGFAEDTSGTAPRRANPHMHMLEAMLAWHDATGEDVFLDRAEAMVELFDTRFFDPVIGTVREFFADDWTPLSGDASVAAAEPGHHYEWAWLLMRFAQKRARPGIDDKARALFATARAFGHHPATGAVADTMQPDGSGLSATARCWPQTEALKAAIALERHGISGAGALRGKIIDVLFDHYLARPVPGGWVDAIDANGKAVAADMPASTLYHVVCALAEHVGADD